MKWVRYFHDLIANTLYTSIPSLTHQKEYLKHLKLKMTLSQYSGLPDELILEILAFCPSWRPRKFRMCVEAELQHFKSRWCSPRAEASPWCHEVSDKPPLAIPNLFIELLDHPSLEWYSRKLIIAKNRTPELRDYIYFDDFPLEFKSLLSSEILRRICKAVEESRLLPDDSSLLVSSSDLLSYKSLDECSVPW